MGEIKRENYVLYTTVKFGDSMVERVLCKVYLPRKVTDSVSLYLHPHSEQERLLEPMFEFSIFGEIEHPNGAITIVRADKVYFMGGERQHWGSVARNNLKREGAVGRVLLGGDTEQALDELRLPYRVSAV
jgi:hypothetical protein